MASIGANISLDSDSNIDFQNFKLTPNGFFVQYLPKLFSEFTTHFPQEVKRVDPANRLPCPIQPASASLSKTVG